MTDKPACRIGCYICHCGTNIAQMVDVEEVAKFAEGRDNVVVARHYKYMCSDPGQEMIVNDIKEKKLDRVVVASCSPRMHEPTFQKACERAGLNKYLFEMANIREHCAWVHEERRVATEKAKALVNAAIRRIAFHEPLEDRKVPIHPDAVVVGGGIAGITAALNIADGGSKVYLVEKEPSIGGHMSQFDKTFPTLDCSACILTPKMTAVGQHPNIELLTCAEVANVDGYIGSFKVKIRKKARYVDIEKCTGCGICWTLCPSRSTPRVKTIRIKTKFGDQLVRRAPNGNGSRR
jgi:heterodisulfide reductase subunit A